MHIICVSQITGVTQQARVPSVAQLTDSGVRALENRGTASTCFVWNRNTNFTQNKDRGFLWICKVIVYSFSLHLSTHRGTTDALSGFFLDENSLAPELLRYAYQKCKCLLCAYIAVVVSGGVMYAFSALVTFPS